MAYCGSCKDRFDPIESRESFTDEPVFCSEECYDESVEQDLNAEAYDEASTAAPVF